MWFSLVSEIGFPAVVTLYLLYRIEAKLDKLNDSITLLPERMRELPLKQKKSG